MVQTEAQRRANDKYNREKIDHVHVRLPKGKRDLIMKHINTTADGSLNGFICRAIDETIDRDRKK